MLAMMAVVVDYTFKMRFFLYFTGGLSQTYWGPG